MGHIQVTATSLVSARPNTSREATSHSGNQDAKRESLRRTRSHAEYKLVAQKKKERKIERATAAVRPSRVKIVTPQLPLVNSILHQILHELEDCRELREECPICSRLRVEASSRPNADKFVVDEEERQLVRACTGNQCDRSLLTNKLERNMRTVLSDHLREVRTRSVHAPSKQARPPSFWIHYLTDDGRTVVQRGYNLISDSSPIEFSRSIVRQLPSMSH